ncbi:MAG: Rpn family recombination-promoting nuclease/putative transposase, partial [Pedobacter sp.]
NEHPGETFEEAKAIFDLSCTGDLGEKFIIEVQHSPAVNFKKRSVYYTSRLISEQAVKGESQDWKYNITEVYLVAILEGKSEISLKSARYVHDVCMCYRDSGEIFYDGLGYIFLDLSNFVKAQDECSTGIDHWLYWLKHVHDAEALPENLKETIFEEFFNIAEYTNLSKEERKMYDQDLKRKRDNAAAQEYSRQTGIEEGFEQGIEKGENKGIEMVTRELIALEIPLETIMKATHLTKEQIDRLRPPR